MASKQSSAIVRYCRTCINAGKEVYENVFYCPYLGHGTHSQVNCKTYNKPYVIKKKDGEK